MFFSHSRNKENRGLNSMHLVLLFVPLVNVGFYSISINLFLICNMIMIILFILKIVWEKFNFQKKFMKYKWFKKLHYYLIFRKFKQQSRNLTQTQLLFSKFLMGIPIEDDENEVKSFNDFHKHLGENWPFMVPVKNTRDQQIVVNGKRTECVSSYSYLDLTRDERIQQAAFAAAGQYSSGNHGPRMLCGNLEILEQLEGKIANFFRRESALVFSSGYLACMSAISGIARKGDLLLMDKLSHMSLRAGAKLSSAKTVYFKHNDFKDAEKLIKKNKWERVIMVIEGVYSMDGDVGFLDQARNLCDKYGGLLILDEAHSLGTIGKTGHGTEEMYDWKYKADIICGSLTKSVASVGGYIACSKELRNFYTFFGSGFVFSAPLSAYHCGAAFKAFEIIENEPERVEKLQKNSEYLRNKFREQKFNIGDTISCVIPVIFRDAIQCLGIFNFLLKKKGLFTGVIIAPACPLTYPRFRITVSSEMTEEQMNNIVAAFLEAKEANPENSELKEILESF
jgi:7-keto-8-aminopelargonate synthetase-like enzyme